jgi:hypothetical protein
MTATRIGSVVASRRSPTRPAGPAIGSPTKPLPSAPSAPVIASIRAISAGGRRCQGNMSSWQSKPRIACGYGDWLDFRPGRRLELGSASGAEKVATRHILGTRAPDRIEPVTLCPELLRRRLSPKRLSKAAPTRWFSGPAPCRLIRHRLGSAPPRRGRGESPLAHKAGWPGWYPSR